MKNVEEYLEFGLSLINPAEEQILKYYKNTEINFKQDGSEVTEADKNAELVIREQISEKYPDHEILGEEFSSGGIQGADYQWIIDPLDGTTWYSLGVPIFGTLISLLEKGNPIVGIIHFPVFKETIYAGKRLGCWLKREGLLKTQIKVSQTEGLKLNESIVSSSGVHASDIQNTEGYKAYNISKVINKAKKFRFCGDCLQHSLVAQGRVHAGIDTIMQPWDSAAIIPCIEEAGGIVTTLSGEREGIVFGDNLLSSCNENLHHELLEILNSD